jgi:hypothetical protein
MLKIRDETLTYTFPNRLQVCLNCTVYKFFFSFVRTREVYYVHVHLHPQHLDTMTGAVLSFSAAYNESSVFRYLYFPTNVRRFRKVQLPCKLSSKISVAILPSVVLINLASWWFMYRNNSRNIHRWYLVVIHWISEPNWKGQWGLRNNWA